MKTISGEDVRIVVGGREVRDAPPAVELRRESSTRYEASVTMKCTPEGTEALRAWFERQELDESGARILGAFWGETFRRLEEVYDFVQVSWRSTMPPVRE